MNILYMFAIFICSNNYSIVIGINWYSVHSPILAHKQNKTTHYALLEKK
jgi:hypothetical protein